MRSFFLVVLLLATCMANAQESERLSGTNVDFRTTLFFHVADASVQKFIPKGWELSSPTTGPGAGMNLAVILVDNFMSQDGDAKPVPAHRGAILVIPVKKAGAKTGGVMIISGLMTPANSPGAYGLYALATVSMETKTHTGPDGKVMVEENWNIMGSNGNTIEAAIQYERGPMTKIDREVMANGLNEPNAYRIYRYESVSDTVKSVPLGIDRTSKLEFRSSGPQLGALFDGSHSLLAVVSTPSYARRVFVPVAK